jgi:coatomer protein complex subunit gamma
MLYFQATTLQGIERYMKQTIVDHNSAVSSAALVSSMHLTEIAGDVVKRWVNEVQEAINSNKYVCIFKLCHLFLCVHYSLEDKIIRLLVLLQWLDVRFFYYLGIHLFYL